MKMCSETRGRSCHEFRVNSHYKIGNLRIEINKSEKFIQITNSITNLSSTLYLTEYMSVSKVLIDLIDSKSEYAIDSIEISKFGLKLIAVFHIESTEYKLYLGSNYNLELYINGIPLNKLLPCEFQVTSGVFIDKKGFIRVPKFSVLSREEMVNSIKLMKQVSFYSNSLKEGYYLEEAFEDEFEYTRPTQNRLNDFSGLDSIYLANFIGVEPSPLDTVYGKYLIDDLKDFYWEIALQKSMFDKLGFSYLPPKSNIKALAEIEAEMKKAKTRYFSSKRSFLK